MRAKTRIFGEIDIPQDKIITMEKGMIGFSELKNYTLIYNSEKENDKKSIMWLQSMDDGDIAFPVMTPDIIMPDYKPTVNEELLAPLGDLNEENMYVIVTVNVPSDITKIACNLKAPIVVNTDSNKAAQLIVEDDYKVHFPIYDIIKGKKKGQVNSMLALTRKKGESLVINNDIEITILEIRGDQIKLGVSAPKEVPIYRKEVYTQIQQENMKSADAQNAQALKELFG